MSDYIYFLAPVNDDPETDREAWQDHANHVPTAFTRLVCSGVDPETAADLADDGLLVCDDPPEFADDGELVVAWPTMYEEAF